MDKRYAEFFSAYMTLRSFANCLPKGCFIKFGEDVIVGKDSEGNRFAVLSIDGQRIKGNLSADSWGFFKKLVKALVKQAVSEQEISDERALRDIIEKQEDRIASFIKKDLSSYLNTIRRHYHGNEGWAGRITLAGVLNAMKVYGLPFEVYASGVHIKDLKDLQSILEGVNVKIKAYPYVVEKTKEKEPELEDVLEALKEVGKAIKDNMEPVRKAEMYAPRSKL